MRVIAGKAGGIPLRIPKTNLRPTMDMVRGAIFSSLAERVPGAQVLDLFSGSGSLAIEALSRGAAGAVLVDADRRACECAKTNLLSTKLDARVVCMDVFTFLNRKPDAPAFDLIFADPPYAQPHLPPDLAAQLLKHPVLPSLLAPDGLLILEVAKNWSPPATPLWSCLRRKKYGATEIFLLQPFSEADEEAPPRPDHEDAPAQEDAPAHEDAPEQ